MYGALRGEVQAKALQAQIAGLSSEIERSCSAWSAASGFSFVTRHPRIARERHEPALGLCSLAPRGMRAASPRRT